MHQTPAQSVRLQHFRSLPLALPLASGLAVAARASAVLRRARNTGRYLNVNDGVAGCCELCSLDRDLTIHHLIPKVHWKRMKKRRQVSGKDEPPTAILCRTCHSKVHRTFTHSELGRNYNTVEALEEAPDLQEYLESRRPWGHAQAAGSKTSVPASRKLTSEACSPSRRPSCWYGHEYSVLRVKASPWQLCRSQEMALTRHGGTPKRPSMAESTHDHLFKLLIIGDSGVGKSSILLRFCDDEFNEKQASTIGVDFKTKFLQVRGKKLKLALWDTAGQERFRTLTSSYYRGAQGIILCYDCTQRSSFEHVKFWQDEVRKYSTNQDAILMLVSNKVDLADQQVTRTEGEEFAFANSMMFIETSAKTRQKQNTRFMLARRTLVSAMATVLAFLTKPPAICPRVFPAVRRFGGKSAETAPAVFLVRHGESTWNLAAKRLDLWTMFRQVDHALTTVGVEQASRLRSSTLTARRNGDVDAEQFLSPQSLVFASPLSRAVATSIVALGLERKITLLPDARELAYPWCGPDSIGAATGSDIAERALQDLSKVDSAYCQPPMAEAAAKMIDASAATGIWWSRFREPKGQMQQRLQNLLSRLRPADSPSPASVLVCHSLLIQRLFKDFASPRMEVDMPELLSQLRASKLQNCGVVKVLLDDNRLISSAQLMFGTKLV
ncbi:Ras-related protein Rab-18 [Symbiodinium microadriaticum]|uniref:Ras-related protein Rab-18 n=1 Tax=Symbiodinium microadriaticum TaxID=2951 RepID=A0A1Q9CYF6_SYMMI|nr:Ras-related protein Rab-18 [Symbiodinium microadriaticum]